MKTKTYKVLFEKTDHYSGEWLVRAPESMSADDVRKNVERHLAQCSTYEVGEYDYSDERAFSPDESDSKHEPHLHLGADGREYTAPVFVGAPEDRHWFDFDGHQWATNGWVAIRKDGPRIDPSGQTIRPHTERAWVTTAPDMAVLISVKHSVRLGKTNETGPEGEECWAASGVRVQVDPVFAVLLDGADEVFGQHPRSPLFGFFGGELKAVVMPRWEP